MPGKQALIGDGLLYQNALVTLHLALSAVPHLITVHAAIHHWQLDSHWIASNIPGSFCDVFPQSFIDSNASLGHNETLEV